MASTARTVYLMKEAGKSATVGKPRVSIERTAKGMITCSVEVTARTLAQARERAQEEFTLLLKYAKKLDPVAPPSNGKEAES